MTLINWNKTNVEAKERSWTATDPQTRDITQKNIHQNQILSNKQEKLKTLFFAIFFCVSLSPSLSLSRFLQFHLISFSFTHFHIIFFIVLALFLAVFRFISIVFLLLLLFWPRLKCKCMSCKIMLAAGLCHTEPWLLLFLICFLFV